jgi:hypothetical protein
MANIRRDEAIEDSGLSTAALAHADEPVEQKLVENREDGRDMSASIGAVF